MAVHKLIFIHGMGEGDPQPDYDLLYQNIAKYYKGKESLEMVPVQWYEATDEPQNVIFQKSYPDLKPSPELFNIFHPVRSIHSFMTFYIGDIIAYTAEPTNENGIRRRVWEIIESHCRSGPYSLVAHSLGSIIAFDYLYKLLETDAPLYVAPKAANPSSKTMNAYKKNFRNFYTFGAPIGLFMLRQGKLWTSAPTPFADIKNPVTKDHKWINFCDKLDIAAYPLKSLFASNPKNKSRSIVDVPINTWGFIVNSHTNYWKSRQIARQIADSLSSK